MIQSLLEGISMGLLLSVIIGPVFFTLIASSMQYGFRYAMSLALGILASDSMYALATYFGIRLLASEALFEQVLGYAGGLILIGFGLSSLLKRNKLDSDQLASSRETGRKRAAFAKGFSINGINPFVLLFWVSIASLVSIKVYSTGGQVLVYYSGILLTVFSTDLLKAFVAKQLSRFVTPSIMGWLNKLVGLAMIAFGIRMLVYAYLH